MTVIKDIDSDPGRGASTGDGMARNQHFYGVVGQIYDGTVRDIPGPLHRVWLGSSSSRPALPCFCELLFLVPSVCPSEPASILWAGIQKVGIPTMGWGTVPGHGPFLMRSVGKTVTVGQMEIATGDIIFADTDGATKVCTARWTAAVYTRALLQCPMLIA